MDSLLRVLTWICLAVPVVLAIAAMQAPLPARTALFAVTGAMVVTYAAVWFAMRPKEFVVESDGLTIQWPVRRRRIDRAAITAARVLDRPQLRQELGRILRIGAGGLGGGFGWASTARGVVELWVSRTDWMVLVECTGRRSLLITPEDPERFVAELVRPAG